MTRHVRGCQKSRPLLLPNEACRLLKMTLQSDDLARLVRGQFDSPMQDRPG